MEKSEKRDLLLLELKKGSPFFSSNDAILVSRNKFDIVAQKLKRKSWLVFTGALIVTIIFLLNSVFSLFGFLQEFNWFSLALSFLWFWLGASILIWSLKKFSNLRRGSRLLTQFEK